MATYFSTPVKEAQSVSQRESDNLHDDALNATGFLTFEHRDALALAALESEYVPECDPQQRFETEREDYLF
tara:strand:+ start:41 stop:253 length:213 start_codon:yes stop_codon:yes gene_type:complete